MASNIARMHEFHFHHANERRVAARADAETRSGQWMMSSIIAGVAVVGLGAAMLGYMRAPALAAGPAPAPISRSWEPDPELALASARLAAARSTAPVVAPPTVAAPAAVAAEQPIDDSDNPY